MKYSVVIQDLTADQARDVINELESVGEYIERGSTQEAGDETTFDHNVIDTEGLPWDERIHSSTKGVNKNGTWKAKRGVQPFVVEQVTAELRARNAASSETIQTMPSPGPVAPVTILQPSVPFTPPIPLASPVQPAPMPVAAPVPPLTIERNFQGFMAQISKLFSEQRIPPTYPRTIVDRINTGFGVNVATISDIGGDPRYVTFAWQCLDLDGTAN